MALVLRYNPMDKETRRYIDLQEQIKAGSFELQTSDQGSKLIKKPYIYVCFSYVLVLCSCRNTSRVLFHGDGVWVSLIRFPWSDPLGSLHICPHK